MQLLLDVLTSVCIKRKKPWPKLAWLGQEHDGLYILDSRRISELYISSGKTKKKIAKLHNLMNDVCAISVSQNGQYLCGALSDGKIFLWEKDRDKLQFITGLPRIFNDADKGNSKNKIFLSSCGTVMILIVGYKKLFLWNKNEKLVSGDGQDIGGTWSQVHHGEYDMPDQLNKETAVDGVFYTDHIVGRCGALSYVFNKGTDLAVTTLNVDWHGPANLSKLSHKLSNQDNETVPREVTEAMKCSIKWKCHTRPLYGITPAARVVKGRFVYICRYSPDSQLLAIVLNQKSARDTRLMFYSTRCTTASIVDLKCCGGSDDSSGRVWWVSDIAWTQDSLFLAGITRNGALFMMSKFGEPINLVTSGCKMEMGPSLFVSLHPRVTARSFQENIPPDHSEISSGSEKDVFHQKFSVAIHPSLPVLLCSDGYIVTILQFSDKPDHAETMAKLIEEASLLLPKTDHFDATNVRDVPRKRPQDMSRTAAILYKMGTPSENSSPSSTLSTTGYGLAKNMDAGVVTFSETRAQSETEMHRLSDEKKLFRAKSLFLQALGIGASCGPHWTTDMSVAMNLVIHTWQKLFRFLLEHEINSTPLLAKEIPFQNIMQFVRSIFEIFLWDVPYQHCLPWFSLFASSTVKSLICSNVFGRKEIIENCFRILEMAEASVNQVYSWHAVSDTSTVHVFGDSFLPSSSVPVTTAMSSANHSEHAVATASILSFKLERSWLVLYDYVCKVCQSSSTPGADNETDRPVDEYLVTTLCFIQRKLQEMNCSRNLVAVNKMDSAFDQGQTLYLEGNHAQAVNILKESFNESSRKVVPSRTVANLVEPRFDNFPDAGRRETGDVSEGGVSTVQKELSPQLTTDTDTLLAILHINLENYDLKAALALTYTFINTTRGDNLLDVLYTGTKLDEALLLFPASDPEGRISSSSPLTVLQLSLLTEYPLAWIVDSCALAVVQQLARFMCYYFTNLPLIIPVPFQSGKLKSCVRELDGEPMPRVCDDAHSKTLSQQRVTRAVAQQKVEGFWTAGHTMELLLVSGLLGEAAWFAARLGDWKIAYLLSVSNELHRKSQTDLVQSPRGCLYFPPPAEVVRPQKQMLAKINALLLLDDHLVPQARADQASFSDEVVVAKLENAFKASVIGGLDLVPVVLEGLVALLREKVSQFDWMVAQDLYLPAPPLYCPQPTRNEEEVFSERMRKETVLRSEVADVVQKILAVYRGSNCFLLCAQEYCKQVSLFVADDESDILPNVLKEFIASDSLRWDVSPDDCEDLELPSRPLRDCPVSVRKVLRSFQEFCGLMWLLHTRDKVALTSRGYSKMKQTLLLDEVGEYKLEVIRKCEEALTWLTRLLPFSHFLDATHHVLDGMLTLIAELPLTSETVGLLAQYFHPIPQGLSLSTAEKLKRLTRRMRNICGPGGMVGDGDPLWNCFQEKCEERRRKTMEISRDIPEMQPPEKTFEFCYTLDYEKDSAYLRFLDTFLLITSSKIVSGGNSKNIPLIEAYKNQLERVEIFTDEQRRGRLAKTPKHSSPSSLSVQRSQSFQDVRRKSRAPLLSPDSSDYSEHAAVHRSNSLTDLKKGEQSNLGEELQAMLPRLIWLTRWCSVEEGHIGTPGVNRGVSLLNVASSHAAIRVQVPLRMIVNSLWLLENYYSDFIKDKERCVKGVSPRRVRRKRLKGDRKKKTAKKKERKIKPAATRGAGREEETEIRLGSVVEDAGGQTRAARGETGEKEAGSGLQNRGDSQAVQETVNSEKFCEKVPVDSLATSDRQEKGNIVDDKLLRRRYSRRKKPRMMAQKRTDDDKKQLVLSEVQAPPIMVQDFDCDDMIKDMTTSSGVNKKLFTSSSSSPVDSKWAVSKDEMPLLTLPLFNHLLVTYDKKNNSNISPEASLSSSCGVLLTTDLDSAKESRVLSSQQLNLADHNESTSSESLSVGQIRKNVFGVLKPNPIANTMPLVESEPTGSSDSVKERRPGHRKIVEKSSSGDTSDKHSAKTKDEATLLRRIIRSEMRKFIKSHQAQLQSQSSPVETTEDDILDETLSSDKKPSPMKSIGQAKHRNRLPNLKKTSRKSTRMENNRTEDTSGTSLPRGRTDETTKSEEQESSCQSPQDTLMRRDDPNDNCTDSHEEKRLPDARRAGKVRRDRLSATQTHRLIKPADPSNIPHYISNFTDRPSDISPDPSRMQPHPPSESLEPSNISSEHANVLPHPPGVIYSQLNLPAQAIPTEHPFPNFGMNGWPFWYQNPFPVPFPWPWPNAASRVNDDKGIQVGLGTTAALDEDKSPEASDIGLRRDGRKAKDKQGIKPGERQVALTSDQPLLDEHVKDTSSSVAVQTDTHDDELENVYTAKPVNKFTGVAQPALRTSHTTIRDDASRDDNGCIQDVRNTRTAPKARNLDNESETVNSDPQVETRINDISSFQKQQNGNNSSEPTHEQCVFEEKKFARNIREEDKNYDISHEGFEIPLLKIPSEVSHPGPSSLPFRIAWPDETVERNIVDQLSAMPLLQLEHIKTLSEPGDFGPFPPPATNLRESFPLLNLSSPDQGSSLENFRILGVPLNQNVELPFLHFEETDKPCLSLPRDVFLQNSKPVAAKTKFNSYRETRANGIAFVGDNSVAAVNTPNPRARRRWLNDSATSRPPAMRSSQRKKRPLQKQTSSESPSSEAEVGKGEITVQSVENRASRDGITKKKKPTKRREKLCELNNIIRDLERNISDESDLVFSEVSELLSQEIKYENFEKKPQRGTRGRSEIREQTSETPVKENDKGLIKSTLNRADMKPSAISRLHKPSAISAHDIHSEYSATVPEERTSSDAKVGTIDILRLPASVQTEAAVEPLESCIDLPQSPRRLKTVELSVQTDLKEVAEEENHPELCDAGMNTENTLFGKEESFPKSVFPRLPPDVYVDLDLDKDVVQQSLPRSSEDKAEKPVEKEPLRMFISVADIAPDVVRREFNGQPEISKNNVAQQKYLERDESVQGDKPDAVRPEVVVHTVHTDSQTFQAGDDGFKGDRTTVDAFSSLDLQSSRSYPVSHRVDSEKEVQKISKERLSLRLQEMNEQFDVIDRLTSNMDRDLQRSNMLLRTIENLNKVADHDSPRERPRENRRKVTSEEAIARGFGEDDHIETLDVDIKSYRMKDEKRPVWQDPPWVNKPIKELTEITDTEKPEAKNKDSLDGETVNDDGLKDTEDIGGSQDMKLDESESEQGSRKTSVSSAPSRPAPSEYIKELPQSTSSLRNDKSSSRRFSSAIPQDVASFSVEKLNEFLAKSPTTTVGNSRVREKGPQKQQELKEWMTKKRKIRHKEWSEKLNEKRQTEHKPFQSNETIMSSKKLKKAEKERQDNRKAQKKENADERLASAYDLMNEMITEPVPKARIITQAPTRSAPRRTKGKAARVNNRYKDSRGVNAQQAVARRAAKRKEAIKETLGTMKIGPTSTGFSTAQLHFDDTQNATVYDYDIQESGRRFITRKSYERYQDKMSGSLSLDLERSRSLGRTDAFDFKRSFDSHVDRLLDDVSVGGSLDERIDNLDSLLSGDSELRELLSDVIVERGKPRQDLFSRKVDEVSVNSRTSFNSFSSNDAWRRKAGILAKTKENILDTFEVAPRRDTYQQRRFAADELPVDTLVYAESNGDDADNMEMSGEVAALLAEAKAAVGDDFSGTSEVGDIDWNEVDHVLQDNG